MRDALRLLRRERAAHEEKFAIFRREVQIGLDDIEAGRISLDAVEDIAQETLAAHRARRA